MDADGFLVVSGRRKSLLIGHDGEKYSPEAIEETIVTHSPLIGQIMLYNNQSQYTSALVVPNGEALAERLVRENLSCRTVEGQDAALSLIEAEIDDYRNGGRHAGMFPERWLPSAFVVLDEAFTEQNQLLNSTLKLVRWRVAEVHKDRLALLYTPEGKNPHHPLNRETILRLCAKSN